MTNDPAMPDPHDVADSWGHPGYRSPGDPNLDDNSPTGLAEFFGNQAMTAYHELRSQPASPKRSAAIEFATLQATLATYHLLRDRYGS